MSGVGDALIAQGDGADALGIAVRLGACVRRAQPHRAGEREDRAAGHRYFLAAITWSMSTRTSYFLSTSTITHACAFALAAASASAFVGLRRIGSTSGRETATASAADRRGRSAAPAITMSYRRAFSAPPKSLALVT